MGKKTPLKGNKGNKNLSKAHYASRRSNGTEMIQINKHFIDEFYLNSPEMLEANIYVHRIFANIILSLKEHQFHTERIDYQQQLNMFTEQFYQESHAGVTFTLNSYEICKGGNYKKVEDALHWLRSYKEDWHYTTNQHGDPLKFLGGLIDNVFYDESTKCYSFFINSFWVEKIVNLSFYNTTYYGLIQNLSSPKHIYFWHWLSVLPEAGTQIKFTSINERFKLNYKDSRTMCKGFLKPIKEKFDRYSHQSFNFSYSKDKIKIVKYQRKVVEFAENNKIGTSTAKQLRESYTIGYLNRRHELSAEHIGKLKMVRKLKIVEFVEGYKRFISNCRKKKISASHFKGDDFMNEFQKAIKQYYNTTKVAEMYPNGYPSILN